MARTTLIAAAASALLGAAPVLAQECDGRINELTGDTAELVRQGGGAAIVVRELQDAAVRLAEQDLDEACLATVEAIQAALDAYGPDGGAGGPLVVQRPVLAAAEIEARAVPFREAGLATSALENADVYNYENDYLGEVENVLVRGGRPTHVLVTPDGILNRGPVGAAIPVSLLRWDPEWEAFFVPITSQALEDAPAYAADAGQWSPEENDRYYEGLIE